MCTADICHGTGTGTCGHEPSGNRVQVHLNDYNLFLLGDYSGGHDVQGKVAAGGNVSRRPLGRHLVRGQLQLRSLRVSPPGRESWGGIMLNGQHGVLYNFVDATSRHLRRFC